MLSAALVLRQGNTVGAPKRAIYGELNGSSVVASNASDDGVGSWLYELCEVPPGSALTPFAQGPGPLSTLTLPTVDAIGSFRIRLGVFPRPNGNGMPKYDIRNVIVRTPNMGIIIPPAQFNPPQLPLTGPDAQPDELNVGGQNRGYAGTKDFPGLHAALLAVDDMYGAGASIPLSTSGSLSLADAATLPTANGTTCHVSSVVASCDMSVTQLYAVCTVAGVGGAVRAAVYARGSGGVLTRVAQSSSVDVMVPGLVKFQLTSKYDVAAGTRCYLAISCRQGMSWKGKAALPNIDEAGVPLTSTILDGWDVGASSLKSTLTPLIPSLCVPWILSGATYVHHNIL